MKTGVTYYRISGGQECGGQEPEIETWVNYKIIIFLWQDLGSTRT